MCDLCLLVRRKALTEKILFEDKVCMVVKCRKCKVPMVVLKRHGMKGLKTPKCRELDHMLAVVKKLGLKGKLDFKQRNIKDHYHFHLR